MCVPLSLLLFVWFCVYHLYLPFGYPGGTSSKGPACQCRRQETQVQSLGQDDPLEEGMATHSSVLAWRIPGTGEPGGLPSMGRTESDMTEATKQQQQQR